MRPSRGSAEMNRTGASTMDSDEHAMFQLSWSVAVAPSQALGGQSKLAYLAGFFVRSW